MLSLLFPYKSSGRDWGILSLYVVTLAHLPLFVTQLSLMCRIGVHEEGGSILGSPFIRRLGRGGDVMCILNYTSSCKDLPCS